MTTRGAGPAIEVSALGGFVPAVSVLGGLVPRVLPHGSLTLGDEIGDGSFGRGHMGREGGGHVEDSKEDETERTHEKVLCREGRQR